MKKAHLCLFYEEVLRPVLKSFEKTKDYVVAHFCFIFCTFLV